MGPDRESRRSSPARGRRRRRERPRGEEDDARVGLEGGKAMAAAAFAVSAIVGAVDAAEAYEGKVRRRGG